MENSEYRNKEIEAFLESEYVNIQEGESRVLEFLKNKEKVVKKPDFNGNPIEKVNIHSNRSRRSRTNRTKV